MNLPDAAIPTSAAHGTQRVFFACWPDAEAQQRLADLAQALALEGGRPVRAANLHLTLAFIGATTPAQVEQLQAAASHLTRLAPSDFRLDRVGYWRHAGVVWAGCHDVPSGCRRLHAALVDALRLAGVPADPRPWIPHVTLVRHGRGDRLPDWRETIAWTLDRFSLVASELHPSGARYRILQEWPLRG